jgi:SWIM/SEC-C metal-binding protein
MAKLGSKKRPITVRVQSEEKAMYIAEKCTENGWTFLIGLEEDETEDITDFERMVNPSASIPPRQINQPIQSTKIERNTPCPCGSGKKYKKCCGANTLEA